MQLLLEGQTPYVYSNQFNIISGTDQVDTMVPTFIIRMYLLALQKVRYFQAYLKNSLCYASMYVNTEN